MNFINTIFSLQDYEYVQITPKKLEEVRKGGDKNRRLSALNQLDENRKKS
jgi:hypothetical protein